MYNEETKTVIYNEEVYYITQSQVNKELILLSCGITYPDKSYHIIRPKSDVTCIEYVEEGSGTIKVDGKSFSPEAGDSYLLVSGKDHDYFSSATHPWKKYWVNISGSLADSLLRGYQINYNQHLTAFSVKDELLEIIELAKHSSQDQTEAMILCLNKLCFKIYTEVKKREKKYDISDQMMDYLDKYVSKPFKMEMLCKEFSCSEATVLRIFKKAFDATPYACLLNKKIAFAKMALTNTNMSVKQIASYLGFCDAYYFSNAFKKKTNLSPSEWRKTTLR